MTKISSSVVSKSTNNIFSNMYKNNHEIIRIMIVHVINTAVDFE